MVRVACGLRLVLREPLVLSVASQTEDLAAPDRLLAKRHGGVVLSTKATHELAHAPVDRTLKSLRVGGARVVSSEGVVHAGPAITGKDVSWEVKCPCCAQYKAVNQAVGSGRSVREAAGEAAECVRRRRPCSARAAPVRGTPGPRTLGMLLF